MRIAIWYNLPSGGGKRALYDQVKGLLERGHYIEVWCPPTANRRYMPLEKMVEEHVVPLSWDLGTSRYLKGFLGHVYLRLKFRALSKHSLECAHQINKGGFQILFSHSCMLVGAPYIGRYINLPKILFLQEPFRSIYEATATNPWSAMGHPRSLKELLEYPMARIKDVLWNNYRRIHIREECKNAQAFDQILVNSHFSRESVLRSYGISAKVCYLGIDLKRFKKRRRERKDIVVTVGGITRSKRLGFIVEAISYLPKPWPKLCCITNVIDDNYYNDVKNKANVLGVDMEVKSEISDEELLEILSSARLLAYAPRLEPFGYVPLEANACGLPVVAVAEGGVRETVIDGVNGLLVEDDPKAMAKAMNRLLKNKNYADELGKRGIEHVNRQWNMLEAIKRLERFLLYAVKTN